MKRSKAEWERLVIEYRNSDETQARFAKRRGIAMSTLQYWNRRVRRDAAPIELLPVRVLPGASDGGTVEIRVGDVVIRMPAGSEPEQIVAIARAFAEPRSARTSGRSSPAISSRIASAPIEAAKRRRTCSAVRRERSSSRCTPATTS